MAGESGISKEIYYIDSMETPTLTGFLRPNELILTTGYSNLVLNRRTTELVVLIGHLLGCEAAVINEAGEVESSTTQFGGVDYVEKRPVQVGSRIMGYLAISRSLGNKSTSKRCASITPLPYLPSSLRFASRSRCSESGSRSRFWWSCFRAPLIRRICCVIVPSSLVFRSANLSIVWCCKTVQQ
ncbi:hypothetical protein EDM55_05630 [Brevibacillus centrosporus]|nr:hypothetical protein EDM55_05630 [Brevibacillus centrosporus]